MACLDYLLLQKMAKKLKYLQMRLDNQFFTLPAGVCRSNQAAR